MSFMRLYIEPLSTQSHVAFQSGLVLENSGTHWAWLVGGGPMDAQNVAPYLGLEFHALRANLALVETRCAETPHDLKELIDSLRGHHPTFTTYNRKRRTISIRILILCFY